MLCGAKNYDPRRVRKQRFTFPAIPANPESIREIAAIRRSNCRSIPEINLGNRTSEGQRELPARFTSAEVAAGRGNVPAGAGKRAGWRSFVGRSRSESPGIGRSRRHNVSTGDGTGCEMAIVRRTFTIRIARDWAVEALSLGAICGAVLCVGVAAGVEAAGGGRVARGAFEPGESRRPVSRAPVRRRHLGGGRGGRDAHRDRPARRPLLAPGPPSCSKSSRRAGPISWCSRRPPLRPATCGGCGSTCGPGGSPGEPAGRGGSWPRRAGGRH